MSILQAALAFGFGIALAGAAGWCLWHAIAYERPPWTAPSLTLAVWWVGQLLAWTLLTVLVGGILGAVAAAAWKLVNGGA